MRQQFKAYTISSKFLYLEVIEPLFTQMIKQNVLYLDRECSRFSLRRIDETWTTYDELLHEKYPGYVLCSERLLICNKSDITVCMDELITLLRSKDLERYYQVKDRLFGP